MTGQLPKIGELVVAEVTEVHSNSIEAKLLEYDRKAFLNVANVPGLWIRDIKKFMKKREIIVAKISRLDVQVELSMKNVSKYDTERKLQYFREETKSVRMFKTVSKEFGIDDKSVDEAVLGLKDRFGGVYESLKKVRDGETDLGLKQEFASVIERFSSGEKTYEFKGEIELHSDKGHGVECIKKAFEQLDEDMEASYIGNSKFLIRLTTKEPRHGEKNLEKKMSAVVKKMQSLGGTGNFKKIK